MSRYVIGDVQGCHRELLALLQRCEFDPSRDNVWLVGDLVNRGPESLEVLRWARDLGERCVAVLGNHDLHLLAVAAGVASTGRGDTLHAVLQAPDRDELLHWLRQRPLLHREGSWLMVHAGLWPEWSSDEAAALASEVEQALRAGDGHAFLSQMYGNRPQRWSNDLQGAERLRFAVNVMTRMRLISDDLRLDLAFKGELPEAPPGLLPWFALPHRHTDVRVVSGHWSALGLRIASDMVALDTGCVWGQALTALRLEDGQVFSQPSFQRRASHQGG